MKYSDQVIEDIRNGNDIVNLISQYTELKIKGSSYFGLCPFHNESTPSFSVSYEKQLYYCFGCGASGDVYSFVMKIQNYDFFDAIVYLADKINYTLPEIDDKNLNYNQSTTAKKATLYEIHRLVAREYYENLYTTQGQIALKYLEERRISTKIRKKFGLGYSLPKRNHIYSFLKSKGFEDGIILDSGLVLKDKNNNFYDRFFDRLMFPIIDIQGRIIGFGGRIINDNIKNTAKYLNSPDTLIFNKSNNLFGINFARLSKDKYYILVEGYMDVISLFQVGINNCVGVLGTAFNQKHAKVLKRFTNNVTLLFDSDDAGINATLRAIPYLNQENINTKVLQLKNAKDPDEYIKKFGKEVFIEDLNNAKSYVEFQIEQKLKEYNIEDLFQRVEFTREIAKIIATLQTSIEQEIFVKQASKLTNISTESIFDEVKNLKQNFKVNDSPKKYVNSNYNTKYSKLDEAQRSILYLITTDNTIYQKIKHILNYNEFLEPLYVKLASIIYTLYEKNKAFLPANLLDYFENDEDREKISKIFMLHIDFEDKKILQKSLNDQIKIIKQENIEKNLYIEKNIEKINDLIMQKRNIQNIHIEL